MSGADTVRGLHESNKQKLGGSAGPITKMIELLLSYATNNMFRLTQMQNVRVADFKAYQEVVYNTKNTISSYPSFRYEMVGAISYEDYILLRPAVRLIDNRNNGNSLSQPVTPLKPLPVPDTPYVTEPGVKYKILIRANTMQEVFRLRVCD